MVSLGGAQHYIHWHFIVITWANAIVIALMVLAFVAALVLPYPGSGRPVQGDEDVRREERP
ncbi:MAG: hypothetical protein IRY88_17485 [Rubrobacteraceae bacterium]|uniref:hypothetical protein n=1 Tax=Rubrobacter naiadicus TaxID=1392641 RepID=UPI00236053FA|nr:hypothetical protein [Rubrobacter naiadicus]MBX6765436.1 hypothetical protein [Rubrobacteraceae bacterium]